jgi:hypothetical protein
VAYTAQRVHYIDASQAYTLFLQLWPLLHKMTSVVTGLVAVAAVAPQAVVAMARAVVVAAARARAVLWG